MFHFFKKKVQPEKIEAFCSWFCLHHTQFEENYRSLDKDDTSLKKNLDEIEAELARVYENGYQGSIEFEFGFNPSINQWELYLYHLNHRFLKEATVLLAESLNEKLKGLWIVHTGK